ncbi:MAG: PEP-CTERM sorting domain-containing protein [Paucibacter sp.]|nr:PEP-CTERM sorting domain-containing protein [Roseateles sp.]
MRLSRFVFSILLTFGAVNAAVATTYTYVGSWKVDSGPLWSATDGLGNFTTPIYSGVEAAAAIFGGSASDYVTSTMGIDPALIDFSAWYDGYGQDAAIFSDTLHADPAGSGLYAIPLFNPLVPTWSAWVEDHGVQNVNYAFKVTDVTNNVPEPSSIALVGAALCGIGAVRRKRSI